MRWYSWRSGHEDMRRATGLTTAPVSRLIRAGLLALTGRLDPLTESVVKMGRPPKSPT